MNYHKLKKLEESPTREGMRDSIKNTRDFWDYKDRRCRYHNRVYGNGYNFAQRLLEKNVGKSCGLTVKLLKRNPKYKHDYFFRLGINVAISEVLNNEFVYNRFRSSYFILHNNDTVFKRDYEKRYKYVPKYSRDILEYVNGVVIERRNGIHYFRLTESYYDHVWSRKKQEYVIEEIHATYWQLSKYWLKWYGLENNPT